MLISLGTYSQTKDTTGVKEVKRNTVVITEVDFTFKVDGKEVKTTEAIPHFNPKDEKDIELGIKNRKITREKELGIYKP